MYNRKSAIAAALFSSLLLSTAVLPPAPAAARPAGDPPGAQPASRGEGDRPPPNDHRRGMVFDGLRPGKSGQACHGAFNVDSPAGDSTCTPGPDPAPAGVDVRDNRSTADLAAGDGSGTASDGGSIACIGDGSSGNRVQAIYAVAADVPDRFASIAALIPQWALAADAMYNDSAAQTGGTRHVRWVTNPDCSLSVLKVVLSATGDNTFADTKTELTNLGFTRTDRAYLVWSDANVYCGIGSIWIDDRPGQDNNNNGGRAPRFGRTDNGCWGRTNSTEAHELMHNLGGVQHTAPHSTGGFHCTDENDRMCYSDNGTIAMSFTCPSANEARFDCGHDDYYHSSPAPDSYLGTHWNVASSSFLSRETPPAPPAPPPPPPASRTKAFFTGTFTRHSTSARFTRTAGAGESSAVVRVTQTTGNQGAPAATPISVQVLGPDGRQVALARGTGSAALSATLVRGAHTWVVTGSAKVSFRLDIDYVTP